MACLRIAASFASSVRAISTRSPLTTSWAPVTTVRAGGSVANHLRQTRSMPAKSDGWEIVTSALTQRSSDEPAASAMRFIMPKV